MDTQFPVLNLCMSAEFGNLNLKSSEGMYRGVRVFNFHKNVQIPVQYGPLHILRGASQKSRIINPPIIRRYGFIALSTLIVHII